MPCKAVEQFGVCCALRRIPGEHDQVNGWQFHTTAAKAFSYDTFQAVPVGRVADFLARDGKAESRLVQFIGPVKHREEAVG